MMDWEGLIASVDRSPFSDRDKALVKLFLGYLRGQGLSIKRIYRYWASLRVFGRFIGWGRLEDVDLEEMRKFVSQCFEHYRPESRATILSNIKRFYRWLMGDDEKYPPLVSWIKGGVKRHEKHVPRSILSVGEVEAMAQAARNLRDKALILTLYESGCRPEELIRLRVGDVSWDKYGAIVTIRGKTGSRKVRVISSAPALGEWLSHHPKKDDEDAPLFPNYKGCQMSIEGLNKLIKRIARKAGINKEITPRTFRHSRATHLARHLTEQQLCQYFGWVIGSEAPRVYVHMSGRDLDPALLKLAGIQVEEEEEPGFKPKRCLRCRELNPPTERNCLKCGLTLDHEEAGRLLTTVEEKAAEYSAKMETLLRKVEEALKRLDKLEATVYRMTSQPSDALAHRREAGLRVH